MTALLCPPKVNHIEANDRLVKHYQIQGATALATVSYSNTDPFRILNPTSHPIIYGATKLEAFSEVEQDIATVSFEQDSPPTDPVLRKNTQIPINWGNSPLSQFHALLNEYRDIFAFHLTELGRTGIVQQLLDTGHEPRETL